MNYTWVIADLHGMKDLLDKVLVKMKENGFDLCDPEQKLIQLGDRNDRGPDSYAINEFFKTQQIMFPGQVIVLLGNHDRMMLDVADGKSDLMYYNGGMATAKSYYHITYVDTYVRPDRLFPTALRKSGHYDWLKTLPLFHETPEYFFSHAPIPLEKYRSLPPGFDFKLDEQTLTWSFINDDTAAWVDPNLIPIEEDGNFYGKYKLCVAGHIHGLKYVQDPIIRGVSYVVNPGPRKHGNTILMDTGAGCSDAGYASALRLPDLLVVTSNDEVYNLEERLKEKESEAVRKAIFPNDEE